MVRLDLLNVGQVEETDAILVVLRAPDRGRLLVIETGIVEGQAIALQAQGLRTERPMTHDLMQTMIQGLGARVEEVRIEEFDDETFYAKVILSRAANGAKRQSFDARPSDAIALALRAGAPIYAEEDVLEEAGIAEEDDGRFAALYSEDQAPTPEERPRGGRVLH